MRRAFLDLLRPPQHRWFVRGLWVTHDLNTSTVTELVLPTLAGVNVSEVEARRAAWANLEDNCLTIACAADRASYRVPLPADVVEVLPVAGRRLHAKYLILQYEGQRHRGLARTLTRVIVTSANLTRGGLCTNQEVWALEEVTSKDAHAPSVVVDLLQATDALARELPTSQRDALRRRTREIRRHLPVLRSTRTIRHSLTEGTQQRLLPEMSKPDRLVVISPPFAAGSAAHALRAIGPVLHPDLTLDIYFGSRHSAEELAQGVDVPFLRELAVELSHRCKLRLWAVPEIATEAGEPVRRMLHAKAFVAFFPGSRARMWLGSANLTGRGLGGRNRELLMEVDPGSAKQARAFVDSLRANRVATDQTSDIIAAEELPASIPVAPTVLAILRPYPGTHAGQTYVAGTLALDGELDAIRHLWLRGEPLRLVPEQAVHLAMDGPQLHAQFVGSAKRVELLVRIEADADFWALASIDSADEGGLPKDLRLLMTDLSAARSTRTQRQAKGQGESDGFYLPYDRRLPNVVRMLPRLIAFEEDDLRVRLSEYLDDAVERQVALDLVDALTSHSRAKDPMVRALQRVVVDA